MRGARNITLVIAWLLLSTSLRIRPMPRPPSTTLSMGFAACTEPCHNSVSESPLQFTPDTGGNWGPELRLLIYQESRSQWTQQGIHAAAPVASTWLMWTESCLWLIAREKVEHRLVLSDFLNLWSVDTRYIIILRDKFHFIWKNKADTMR